MNSGNDTEEADRCQSCGKQFGTGDRFCGVCGAVRPAPPTLVLTDPEHEQAEASGFPLSRTAIVGILAGALAIVVVGAGILVARSGGSKNAAQTVSTPLVTEGGATGAPSTVPPPSTTGEEAEGSPSTGSSSTAPQGASGASTAPSATALSGATAPLDAVNRYWADIRAHDFAGAYGYLVPGSIELTESQFVASEREAGIRSVQFHGEVISHSGSSATIEIVSLVTHDARFGCRTWTGSYEMAITGGGGAWRIARANLSPESCSG